MQPIIELKDIWFRYSEEADWVLKGINFSLKQGEWITILGGNGSGKSTFAKLLNGLLLPTQGELSLFGQMPQTEQERWEARQKVGMIFQNPENQIVAMTVEDDIAFGLENLGIPPHEMEQRIDQVLALLKLTEFRKSEPHKLSGGQKQRLAIAGVLAMRPQVMIFDESTSMLDPQGAADVMTIVKELHQSGISIIHITHEVEEALESNRILVFHRGEIKLSGTPREVLNDPEKLMQYGLIPPFAIRVRDTLQKKGCMLGQEIMRVEELAEEIWKSALTK
jgi:energy-coupling factor transport system ATP-binding protein